MDTPAGRAPEVSADLLQQPAVAARAATLLRQISAALVVGIAAVVCNLLGSHTLLRFEDTSGIWPMVANVAAVLGAVVVALQWWVWRQAQSEWTGRKDVALAHLLAPSQLARWVSLLCGVVGPLACLQVISQTSRQEASHWWFTAGALCTILATAFGGVHPLNPAGPRGVLPVRIERGARVVAERPDPDADTLVLRRTQLVDGPDAGSGATAADPDAH